MQELEKILEEIEHLEKIQFSSYTKPLITIEDVEKIIRKHMNDGWIPVDEWMPEESGYYRVTVRNTELEDIMEETAWFAHVDDYDMDESEWRELYEFEKVIAWQELDPYRPEKGE